MRWRITRCLSTPFCSTSKRNSRRRNNSGNANRAGTRDDSAVVVPQREAVAAPGISSLSSSDRSQLDPDSLRRRREDRVESGGPEGDAGAISVVEQRQQQQQPQQPQQQQQQPRRESSVSSLPSRDVPNNSSLDDVFVCTRAPGRDEQQRRHGDGRSTGINGAGITIRREQQACNDAGGNDACGSTREEVAAVAEVPALGEGSTSSSRDNQRDATAATSHGEKVYKKRDLISDGGLDNQSGCAGVGSTIAPETMTAAASAATIRRASASSIGSAHEAEAAAMMTAEEELDVIAELSDYFLTRGVVQDPPDAAGAARVCLALLTQSTKTQASCSSNNNTTGGLVDDQQQCGYIGGPAELVALACDHLGAARGLGDMPDAATTACSLLQWLVENNLTASRLATDKENLRFFVSPCCATFEDDEHGARRSSSIGSATQSVAMGAAATALSEAGQAYGEIMDALGRGAKSGRPFRNTVAGEQMLPFARYVCVYVYECISVHRRSH